ncbi:acylglycerol kinase, mitochondrial-like [Hydractinia symbiolongicarpus]|uniref:acylglycerol kinase, mitochondrial-like n=1 Tax=Hydractinia symbiolongicarpus TaxID=13093 RepID=UPI002551C562|nr:acylglycerol kinase, mitochondrial-like [Hydractinia symbiolongicarpus]
MADGGLSFTLRKHWKKSTVAACLLVYGINYGSKRYREFLIRREYFQEAKKYGDQSCSPLEKPRRLYVILNPQAGNSKCKKLFQKNAAPIFYLAGIDVTFIQTDYEGHAKTIANYFDRNMDGVVVAGGDGTLQEVVTGMLRQAQHDNLLHLPIGVLPMGYHSNSIFSKLFTPDKVKVKNICEAAMAIVKNKTRKVSVMEIKADSKSSFALSSIHIGLNQQVKEQIDQGRFWLLGPLKKYFTYLWRTTKEWPPSSSIHVYSSSISPLRTSLSQKQHSIPNLKIQTASCEERNKLRQSNSESIEKPCHDTIAKHVISCEMTGSYKPNIINCSERKEFFSSDINLYFREADEKNTGPYFILQDLKVDQSKTDFMKYGVQWIQNRFNYTPTDLSDTMICHDVRLTPPENEDLSYGIDGEIFDARPIQVSIYPNKLVMFCGDQTGRL